MINENNQSEGVEQTHPQAPATIQNAHDFGVAVSFLTEAQRSELLARLPETLSIFNQSARTAAAQESSNSALEP